MNSLANDARACYRCNYETAEALDKCPQCGQRLRTGRQVRRLGWVLVVTGTFLVLFMGWITIVVTNIFAHTNDPDATSRFTGPPEMILLIYGLFGFVILFGLVALAAGIWQVKYGRRNKKLAYVILGMGLIFLLIGFVARAFR